MTIQSISIEYDAKNEENFFSSGDSITGRIVLVVSQETKIERLSVKAKGKANVSWTEHYGKVRVTYRAKEKFFSLEKIILQEGQGHGPLILTPGSHEHPFAFEIPDMDLPTSFKGKHGKISYSLKAKVSRFMKLASKAKTHFTVASKTDMSTPDLMKPQHRNVEKNVVWFGSGNVTLNVRTARMGYLQGEALKVTAEIVNNSPRPVTPKYYLYEKQCFYAMRKRKVYTKNILKEKGEPVPARAQQNVTKVLNIPELLPGTIFNCPILKLEYRIKVVLDVALAKDPEVRLPIVVLADTDRSASKELQEQQQRESWFN
ncbi:arrestin domain-containing protein 3-like [Centroberyx affinis]|uniref:arrestin domain-containing protein 3-like n=1 Tax=Centroberyx affinis TaxID=166261 RepID=UPI003A5BE939